LGLPSQDGRMDSTKSARQLAESPLGWMPGDSLTPGRRRQEHRAAASERRFLQPQVPRPAQPQQRWHLVVRGKVQGVGYRASCCRQASTLGLGGWVRNRADGSVEVEAEGTAQALGELQIWCEKGPTGAQVSGVAITRIPVTGCDWFEVRR
jgi:acylphosphatase